MQPPPEPGYDPMRPSSENFSRFAALFNIARQEAPKRYDTPDVDCVRIADRTLFFGDDLHASAGCQRFARFHSVIDQETIEIEVILWGHTPCHLFRRVARSRGDDPDAQRLALRASASDNARNEYVARKRRPCHTVAV